jgi:TolA-binding protein
MRRGLEKFQAGDYQGALYDFRETLLDSRLGGYHGSAYFWIGKSYLGLENPRPARDNLALFLENYPDHPLTEEARYQMGRTLHLLSDHQEAILWLSQFINDYPESGFIPNSYFWIGESLFSLGYYGESERIFQKVRQDFPESYKAEAAGYRLALIEMAYRERVLLNLVKLSHEQTMREREDYQRRLRSYEQALSAYQRRIRLQAEMEVLPPAPRISPPSPPSGGNPPPESPPAPSSGSSAPSGSLGINLEGYQSAAEDLRAELLNLLEDRVLREPPE